MTKVMQRKRLSVSLSTDSFEVLARLSAANGQSMSSIVAELVDAVAEPLSRVADLVEAAQTAQPEVMRNVRSVAERTNDVLEPLMVGNAKAFHVGMDQLLDAISDNPPSV